jgi:hypothetical protein
MFSPALTSLVRTWMPRIFFVLGLACYQELGFTSAIADGVHSALSTNACDLAFQLASRLDQHLAGQQIIPQLKKSFFTGKAQPLIRNVYTVETQHGTCVLKVGDSYLLKKELAFAESFASIGIAPKIIGTVEASTLKSLKISSSPNSIGVVMEYIKDAWEPKYDETPAWVKDLDVEKVIKQFDTIQNILEHAPILALDLQVLITREGAVKLIDFVYTYPANDAQTRITTKFCESLKHDIRYKVEAARKQNE